MKKLKRQLNLMVDAMQEGKDEGVENEDFMQGDVVDFASFGRTRA